MRVTIKSIIKWGLLAEVLTAIVGQVGEFTLRYRAYSAAFDELFGHYRLPGHEVNRSLPLTSSSSLSKFDSMTKNISSAPPFEEFALDAGATTTIKRKGSSKSGQPRSSNDLDRRELRKKESQKLTATTEFPSFTRNSSSSSSSIMSTIFHSASFRSEVPQQNENSSVVVLYPESKTTNSPLFSFDSYAKSLQEILAVPSHSVPTDPRPFLVCLGLVFAHLLFTIGIAYEYLPLITPLTFFWMLYLILVLLILHAGSSGKRGGGGAFSLTTSASVPTASSTLPTGSGSGAPYYVSPWSTLTPSPFTVLVLAIILIFALVLIAIIVEERRQLAVRIRAKSAAIPLVKSRDMDLEDDDI